MAQQSRDLKGRPAEAPRPASPPSLDFRIERLFPPAAEPAIPAEPEIKPLSDNGIFTQTEDGFETKPAANGPFGNLHGGAIGGLLANRAEALALAKGLGTPIGAHIQFLRPLSQGLLTAFAEVAQPGRRLTLVDAFIEFDGGLRAEGRFTFARDLEIPGLPPLPEAELFAPEALPEIAPVHRPPQPWFKDALEWRSGGDGIVWMRPMVPLGEAEHVMPHVIAVADWASGIARPDGWHTPKAAAFPNPSLTIQLWRRPVGDWIGMKPVSRWNPMGFGMSEGTLYDMKGEIGTTCQPVILLPLKG